jgi:hypothetical protein
MSTPLYDTFPLFYYCVKQTALSENSHLMTPQRSKSFTASAQSDRVCGKQHRCLLTSHKLASRFLGTPLCRTAIPHAIHDYGDDPESYLSLISPGAPADREDFLEVERLFADGGPLIVVDFGMTNQHDNHWRTDHPLQPIKIAGEVSFSCQGSTTSDGAL